MENWSLHWLEASGRLEDYRSAILAEFTAAYRALSEILPPPRLDILVQRLAGETIPELGVGGHAYRASLLAMTVDPGNPNFEGSLSAGALRRQILHEVHHCLRMAGPGYGWTLGEALVSEGLAGQFVGKLLGTAPEPWEKAVGVTELRRTPVEASELSSGDYDHPAWFYGGGRHARWLGYSLGYRMVESWLAEAGDIEPTAWINVPAAAVIEAAGRSGLVAAGL